MSLKSMKIREMDVAICRREKKTLNEVCSVHLSVTVASVFRACCDFATRKTITIVLCQAMRHKC